jgi:hypothetical protein
MRQVAVLAGGTGMTESRLMAYERMALRTYSAIMLGDQRAQHLFCNNVGDLYT